MMFVRSKHLLFCLCLLLKSFESKNNVPYWMVLLQLRLPKKFLYLTNIKVSINIEVCKAWIYWQQFIINYMLHFIHYKTSGSFKIRIKVYTGSSNYRVFKGYFVGCMKINSPQHCRQAYPSVRNEESNSVNVSCFSFFFCPLKRAKFLFEEAEYREVDISHGQSLSLSDVQLAGKEEQI